MHLLLLIALLANGVILITAHGGHNDDNKPVSDGVQKLIVISMDGFRHDFLDIYKAPTLKRLASQGVHAKSLTSSYITKTFPNHHSIATGLHEESHGIVANRMYDPDWKEEFYHCSNSSCAKWYGGQPIWHVNELHGKSKQTQHNVTDYQKTRTRRHGGAGDVDDSVVATKRHASGAIYWPGSNASFPNASIQFCENWVSSDEPGYKNFKERIDLMISWFTHPVTPINLGMLYTEYPDQLCHRYGPESDEVSVVVIIVTFVVFFCA